MDDSINLIDYHILPIELEDISFNSEECKYVIDLTLVPRTYKLNLKIDLKDERPKDM